MDDICKNIQQRIAAYIDGELPGDQHQEVVFHLESCHLCKQYMQEIKETDVLLRENISFDLPPEVDLSGVWDAVEEKVDFRPGFLQRLKDWATRPIVWLPAVVAAGATALIFILPVSQRQSVVQISRVESVSSQTGQVMILQTAESGQPLIWIISENKKETTS